MATAGASCGVSDGDLLALFRAIAAGEAGIEPRLAASSELATRATRVGATRADPHTYRLAPLGHYVYAGHTSLHVAAAAHRPTVAELLLARGADVRARNRRGAEPLHYAADGHPGAETWDPVAQQAVIACLIDAGGDPNTLDNTGVAPLHRAVRTRCSGAVEALLQRGADPVLGNGRDSTPLHLAVQNTGRGDSGSEASKQEQGRIVRLLLQSGATPADADANGKSVTDAARSEWIRDLLRGA